MTWSDISVIHVSTSPRMYTQFRMPMIRALQKSCKSQTIYCSGGSESEQLRRAGFIVEDAQVTNKLGLHTIVEIIMLYRFIRRMKFNMLIAHQPMGAVVGILAGFIARVPILIYSTGGLKYVPGGKGIANLVYRYGEMILIHISRLTLLNNMEDYNYLNGLGKGLSFYYAGPKGGCGIDPDSFNNMITYGRRDATRKSLGVGRDTVVLGYSGRIVWEKGFKELIDSIVLLRRKMSDSVIYVLCVGEGGDLGEIKRYAQERGVLDLMMFAGYKSNIQDYLAAFDIFILPSYREGLSVALLEAMAMGLPCIATDIRGNRELIDDNVNGLLVRVNDADSIASAVAALAHDEDKRLAFGVRAMESVHQKYSEDSLMGRLMQAIGKIINGVPDK